jgi:hypothetical protein
MDLRMVVFGLAAAAASVSLHAQAPASGQVPTRVPTELPTELSGRLPAQTKAPAAAANISVEGCVERAQRNGSVGGTGVGTSSSPNTADRDANSSETLDVFQLSDARSIPSDPAAKGTPTSYGLQGQEQELGRHTGHRVQVTGALAPQSADTSTSSAAAAGIRRIRVTAVKMISASCDRGGVR